MTTLDYAVIFFISFLGMILQMLLKANAIKQKAKSNNLIFSFKEFLLDDWLSHSVSVTTIVMFMFFIEEATRFNEHVENYLKIGFAFVGYSSSDIASRLFSVVNKRVNEATGYKATGYDTTTGNLDKPTPTK